MSDRISIPALRAWAEGNGPWPSIERHDLLLLALVEAVEAAERVNAWLSVAGMTSGSEELESATVLDCRLRRFDFGKPA